MPADPLVSVLIVNYNTAALTRRCVASLRAQRPQRADGSVAPIEIVVVDNASRVEERNALTGLDATIVHNDDNRGYGAALNQATKIAHGDILLFSNADTWYFPAALQALIGAVRALPRCGAVGPRLWWDDDRAFLLPPSDPVTPIRYVLDAVARSGLWGHQQVAQHWRRQALRYWRRQGPFVQPMLSGACLVTTRKVLAACGGFDEQFRLYYEDTDWCRRVRRKGYQLYCVPTADVAHLHNQSARQEVAAAQQAGKESERRYWRKYYGTWRGLDMLEAAARWHMRVGHTGPRGEGIDFGICLDPPLFSLPGPLAGEHLWQLSPLPSCIPAIARFVAGTEELVLPAAVWAQLGDGEFFARLFSLPDLRLAQQWRWRKVSCRGVQQ